MSVLFALIRRNVKLFFKDKAMFFTSMVTPLILLVLYVTFLGEVYKDSFVATLSGMGLTVEDSLADGFVAGQLFSSLLAVCSITVAFCSNMLMVQDKANGTRCDLTVSPVPTRTLSLAYYIATVISTAIVCFAAIGVCLIYIAAVGWYLSFTDVLLIFLDTMLLILFGTALSSVIHHFLSTQGQISAVGTIVSAGYGFICGAYMPISQFSEVLQRVLSVLPGTYGTSLLRQHALGGVCREMERKGYPFAAITGLRDSFDCNIYVGGHLVSPYVMYLVIALCALLLLTVFVLLNLRHKKTK